MSFFATFGMIPDSVEQILAVMQIWDLSKQGIPLNSQSDIYDEKVAVSVTTNAYVMKK